MVYLKQIAVTLFLAAILALNIIPAATQTFPGLVATDRLLGRDTAGTGQVEQLTVGGALSFTGSGGVTATGANILTQLLTVDGAGSALDADLLDGISSAAFALDADIGTTIQAWNAGLDALAAFNTNGILVQTATDTFAGRTITGTANEIDVSNGNGVSGNPTIDLPATVAITTAIELSHATANTLTASGGVLSIEGVALLDVTTAAATYQPLDSDLTSWAAVTRASGFDTFTATPSSANIKALVTDETGTGGVLVFATAPDITISATTETNIEAAIDTLANLVSVQSLTVTLADAAANAVFGWDDVAGAYENLTATEVENIIEAADGSGSGLDADLLDGITSADFLTEAEAAAAYQPLDADLTSWAGVTRATGFDTFTATPSSANIKALVTDETGTGGALVFATAPDITISATTETNIEAAIDTLANLVSVQSLTITLADAGANAFFGWDDVAGAYENLTTAEAEAIMEPLIDTLANLTSVQGFTVTLSDAGFDVLAGWDDSAAAYKNFLLADIATEAAAAAGDYVLIYGAEGDLRKVNWSGLPGSAGLPADPGANSILGWDDTANAAEWWTGGVGLTSSTSNLDCDTPSETAVGCIELATTAEADTGTDTSRAVTAAGVLAAVTGRHTIPLVAGAGTLPSGGGIATCTAVAAFDSGSNDVFLRQCSFSASVDNAIYFTFFFPKGAAEATDLVAQVDWTSATATDATDDVIWTAAAVCFSDNDTINGNAFPAVDTVTDTQATTSSYRVSGEITAITPAGTPAEGDGCVIRFTRDADAAGDNFNGTAEAIQFRLYYATGNENDD